MVVVALHRHFRADVGQELRGHPGVLDEDPVRPAQSLGGAWRKVAEVPDRSRDDVQSGGERVFHQPWINRFQFNRKRVIVRTNSSAWGEVR